MLTKSLHIFIVILFTISACKKDDNNGNGQLTNRIDSFPHTVGYSWKYYTEAHIIDSTGFNILSNFHDSYWSVISDTTINGIACIKISQLDSNYNGPTHLAHTYYSNRPDGFYGVAVENQGSMFSLRTTDHSFETHPLLGSFGNSPLGVDTVYIPDTSLKFLKFPSNINDIWLSYEYNNPTPNTCKRKWVGYTTVTTSAGTFTCVKLQMFRDYDYNNLPDSGQMIVYQYFSSKGLIQEEKHAALNSGNGIDSLHQTTKLVQLNF